MEGRPVAIKAETKDPMTRTATITITVSIEKFLFWPPKVGNWRLAAILRQTVV